MRIILGGLAAILALSAPAMAQITIPPKNDAYAPIVATVKADVPEGARMKGGWSVLKPASFRPGAAGEAHIWAPPGKHVVQYRGVWVQTREVTIDGQAVPVLVDFGQVDYLAAFSVGPQPGPDPEPDPDPDPTPRPIKSLYVAIVSETATRSAEQAAVQYEIAKWLRSRNIGYVITDPDSVDSSGRRPAWLQTYLDACQAQGVPLPALLAVPTHEDGRSPASCLRLPNNAQAAIAFLTKYLPRG